MGHVFLGKRWWRHVMNDPIQLRLFIFLSMEKWRFYQFIYMTDEWEISKPEHDPVLSWPTEGVHDGAGGLVFISSGSRDFYPCFLLIKWCLHVSSKTLIWYVNWTGIFEIKWHERYKLSYLLQYIFTYMHMPNAFSNIYPLNFRKMKSHKRLNSKFGFLGSNLGNC